ncbi:MAG: TIGR02996 domain-containing protein [Gemmataceae bacterium]
MNAPIPNPVHSLDQARLLARSIACPQCRRHNTLHAHLVRKQGPNFGRLFMSCLSCGRFIWLRGEDKAAGGPRPRPSASSPQASAEEREQAGLWDEIACSPGDHCLRRIYADWLEDHGQPERARYLRQELARQEAVAGSVEWQVLLNECDQLVRTHGDVWFSALRQCGYRWEIAGGLVERISIDAEGFVRWGKRLVAEAPTAEWTLHYQGWTELRRFVSCEALRQVRRLVLEGDFLGEAVQILSTCKRVVNLRSLDLAELRLRQSGVAILVLSHYLQGLRQLNLSANDLSGSSIALLASSRAFPHLEALSLANNPQIGDAEIRALTHSPHLTRLNQLCLAGTAISSETAEILEAWPRLGQLRYLDVSNTEFGTRGLYRLRRAARVRPDLVVVHTSLSN